jgi:hypothetical protein
MGESLARLSPTSAFPDEQTASQLQQNQSESGSNERGYRLDSRTFPAFKAELTSIDQRFDHRPFSSPHDPAWATNSLNTTRGKP